MKLKLNFLATVSSLFFTVFAIAQTVTSNGPGTLQTQASTTALVQPQNGSIYKIKNVASGRYAQTGNASVDNGATIHLYDSRNDDHFKWKAILMKDGYYKFQNVHSNKFLAILGSSKDVYGILCQWDDAGRQDLLWSLVKTSNGFKLKNKNSGLLAAVEGGSKANEAKLIQWNDAGQQDIVWRFELTKKAPSSATPPPATTGRKVLYDITLNYVAVSEATRNRIDNGDCKRIFGQISTELWELDDNNEMKTKLSSYNNSPEVLYNEPNYNNPPTAALSYYQDNPMASDKNEMGKVTYNIPENLLLGRKLMLVVITNVGTRHKDNDFATYDALKMKEAVRRTFRLNSTGSFTETIQAITDLTASGRNMHIQDLIIPFAVFQRTDDTHKIWVKFTGKKN